MKNKIRIDTMQEVSKFVGIVSQLDGKITITDNQGLCVNAKSVLGALHALEFTELWCESENDIYTAIEDFIVIA